MEFVRTGSYEKGLKRLRKLGAVDGDFEAMEQAIATNPEIGDVIKGSNGLRKVRSGLVTARPARAEAGGPSTMS